MIRMRVIPQVRVIPKVRVITKVNKVHVAPTDHHVQEIQVAVQKDGIERSSDFVSTSIARAFIVFIRHHGRLTLGEMLLAMQLLETLLHKCREKKDNTIAADNLGTALVCVFIVTLKFLRDISFCNSWWAKKFNMNLQTINESEIVILNLMDWRLWSNDKSFIPFYSRVFRV
ncbi:MAG: hypothetical protein EZS28_009815 [Streblomastix strix]|uniref:Cyclin N-terminal domain-containing protein n=1 Tax=Streblomastix strix TaxID=222440 RepID=A0A5J4WK45_9EUKA|nr:MAG: hypothetical protein EZS28_009815 [Streblomastix strix]